MRLLARSLVARPRRESARPPALRRPAARAVRRAACLAAGGAAAAACSEPQLSLDQMQRYAGTEVLGAQAETASVWRPTAEDPVTLRLVVPARAARGVPVPVRVLLHNGGRRPVAVGLGRDQDVEVLVARPDRSAREGALFGPMRPLGPPGVRAAVVTDPIAPGRDSTFEVLWPQTDDLGHRVPSGRYRVRAVLNAQLVARQRLWTDWATVTIDP